MHLDYPHFGIYLDYNKALALKGLIDYWLDQDWLEVLYIWHQGDIPTDYLVHPKLTLVTNGQHFHLYR
jgi:hypothetical protein